MLFHHERLLLPHAAPRPFCFGVREAGRSLDGTVAIEAPQCEPVHTFSRQLVAAPPARVHSIA